MIKCDSFSCLILSNFNISKISWFLSWLNNNQQQKLMKLKLKDRSFSGDIWDTKVTGCSICLWHRRNESVLPNVCSLQSKSVQILDFFLNCTPSLSIALVCPRPGIWSTLPEQTNRITIWFYPITTIRIWNGNAYCCSLMTSLIKQIALHSMSSSSEF